MVMSKNEFGKVTTFEEALHYIYDGCTLMVGGFGGIGTPPTLIDGILKKGVKDLTLICNDTGFPDIGVGRLITAGRVKKAIVSHIGSNPNAGKQMQEGKLEIEFSPQGVLIERIRAGGSGLGGVLVDIGIEHDWIAKGKESVIVKGKKFLVELPLTAHVSIVYAKKADPFGNLVYDKSARNTNPYVAMAGEITIAEVEEIIPIGGLNPEEIITPGIFVDLIVQSEGVNWRWAWE